MTSRFLLVVSKKLCFSFLTFVFAALEMCFSFLTLLPKAIMSHALRKPAGLADDFWASD